MSERRAHRVGGVARAARLASAGLVAWSAACGHAAAPGATPEHSVQRNERSAPNRTASGDPNAAHERALADARGDVERFRIPVSDEPALGPDDALVTIVEWGDYQCPFTARAELTIERLFAEYPGRIRRVWRHNPLPFHPHASNAALLALEARSQGRNEGFWRMHKLLMANQDALDRPDLERHAERAGLYPIAAAEALDRGTHHPRLLADQTLARRVGADATPTFFVNGRLLAGAQPIERFRAVIDDELARAGKLLELGVRQDQLYLAFVRDGRASAPPRVPPAIARKPIDPAAVYHVPVASAATLGPADALVTIVEFADFQCPFSARSQETLAMLRVIYGRDLRIAFRHNPLPFRAQAPLAAEAALAARDQGKFWPYHDLLWANQDALQREDLEAHAERLGLDMAAFRRALDENAHRAEIEADQGVVRALDARPTPAFFINGRLLHGAQPLAVFAVLIEEERKKAQRLAASGTPRAQIYARTIANGSKVAKYLDTPAAPDPDRVYAVDPPATAPRRNDGALARVVIQQFGDFECPFNRRAYDALKALRQQYGHRIQLVWRHHPMAFHPGAQAAAEVASEVFEQAGAEAFWTYHDTLFEDQGRPPTQAELVQQAGRLDGVDAAALEQALRSGKQRARVLADVKALADAGLPPATPTFFINGKLLVGAQPLDVFKAAVDAALNGAPMPPVNNAGSAPASDERAAEFEHKLAAIGGAARLYERACSNGSALGCYRRGLEYLHEHGNWKSPQVAAWFQKGCTGGVAAACVNAGMQLDEGDGVKKNTSKAAELYRKGCDGGEAEGCYMLSLAYDRGEGVPKDAAQAQALRSQACTMGDHEACTPFVSEPKWTPPALPGSFRLPPPTLLDPPSRPLR